MYIQLLEREKAKELVQSGIEKGIEKGIETGKPEGKLEVARNLLANGVSPDVIAKSAELPIEKIRKLMN
jgi:predicted transposase/invertase (TIGR01784 family)